MKTNELKKGTRILLRNGWEADLIDNKKGTIRDATVYGDYTESGSIYAHDIVAYEVKDGPVALMLCGRKFATDIEYTPAQIQCRESCFALGM